MTLMDFIDLYLIRCVVAAAIVVLAVSVFRIRKEILRRKASGIGDGLSFLCREGVAGRMWKWYVTAEAFTVAMIFVHWYKKEFLNAYITGDTVWFYATVFFLFLFLILQNSYINAFRLDKNGCYRCGKRYDRKTCGYVLEDRKLSMYTVGSEGTDAIVLEYDKVAEVRIPFHKSDEAVQLLEEYYAKLPEGAAGPEPKRKKIYKTDIVWGCVVCILAILFIHRGYIVNEWEMTVIEDGIEISAYNGNSTRIDIPREVDGQEVVSIRDFGALFFWKKTGVTTVHFPGGIDRICGDSFVGYKSLEKIYLPSSVEILGENAFRECPSLHSVLIYGTGREKDMVDLSGTDIVLKEMLLLDCDIKDGMLCRYPYLETVTIDGNGQIEPKAFQDCKALRHIRFPDGMETIYDSMFVGCEALRDVDLPNSIKTIGDEAFRGCISLRSIVLPLGAKSIGNKAFYGCGCLYVVRVPYDLEYIGDYAFTGCYSLTHVDLEDTIKKISETAFEGSGVTYNSGDQ